MLFRKKNKQELGVSYQPLQSLIWLKTSAPHRIHEVREDSMFPFFIQLLEEPFQNWVIELVELHDVDGKMSFDSVINIVPKGVTDEDIVKLKKKLNKLLSRVINDIMTVAVDEYKE